jgi:2-dehydro-3-deoxyphosphooctonate aldolase (KDO 8-P synthase)
MSFNIDSLNIGSSLFLIAGPCVIESEAHAVKMAEEISAVTRKL